MMRRSLQSIILAAGIMFCCAGSASAAAFRFSASTSTIGIGEAFKLDILLDTRDESINAVSGTVEIPTLLSVDEVRTGNSVINFWVEEPKSGSRSISFSGITPGGYRGSDGLMFSIVLHATKAGSGTVAITAGKALENDGKGTPASLSVPDFSFTASSISGMHADLSMPDRLPPETFKPEVGRDPEIALGQWFVVFAAVDKGSGIASYQVRESRHQLFDTGAWHDAASPYVLSDQSLESYIYVKAIDKAGNERIMKVAPLYPVPAYENPENWLIIIVLIGLLIIMKPLWRKLRIK